MNRATEKGVILAYLGSSRHSTVVGRDEAILLRRPCISVLSYNGLEIIDVRMPRSSSISLLAYSANGTGGFCVDWLEVVAERVTRGGFRFRANIR